MCLPTPLLIHSTHRVQPHTYRFTVMNSHPTRHGVTLLTLTTRPLPSLWHIRLAIKQIHMPVVPHPPSTPLIFHFLITTLSNQRV